MRIVLLGVPGSGKGTQTEAIVNRYCISTISTGDLLRAEVDAGTKLGQCAKPFIDTGNLVPFDIVLGVIENSLRKLSEASSKGFLIDGFPRDLPQAEALDKLLLRLDQPLDIVLFLDVDYEEIIKRLLIRGRNDDNEDTIRNRLQIFEDKTSPLISYYTKKGLLRKIKGTGDVTDISSHISRILDEVA